MTFEQVVKGEIQLFTLENPPIKVNMVFNIHLKKVQELLGRKSVLLLIPRAVFPV